MKRNLEYSCLKKSSVVESVKNWIITQLINGSLKPGDKLPTEGELSENLGVGRNSLREAVKQLEAQGIVKIVRADGTYITSDFEPSMLSPVIYSLILSNNDWKDLVSLRKAMDIGTLYIITDNDVSSEDKQRLEDKLKELEILMESPNATAYDVVRKDREFHNIVSEMTGNPQMKTIYDYVNELTIPSRNKTTQKIMEDGKTEDLITLHRQWANVIFSRDKSKIEEVVNNHYAYWEHVNS